MLACLYDVHGNLPALEAVLDDARAAGATTYVLGGDYALMGGWPAECVERLRTLRSAVWIRGNVDRWLLDPPEDDVIREAVRACVAAVGPGGVNALANLPERAQVADWMMVHASPGSDLQGFAPAGAGCQGRRYEGVPLAHRVPRTPAGGDRRPSAVVRWRKGGHT